MTLDELTALEAEATAADDRKAIRGSLTVEARDEISQYGNFFHYFNDGAELSRVQFAQLPSA
jgi:hypothetical protein